MMFHCFWPTKMKYQIVSNRNVILYILRITGFWNLFINISRDELLM